MVSFSAMTFERVGDILLMLTKFTVLQKYLWNIYSTHWEFLTCPYSLVHQWLLYFYFLFMQLLH